MYGSYLPLITPDAPTAYVSSLHVTLSTLPSHTLIGHTALWFNVVVAVIVVLSSSVPLNLPFINAFEKPVNFVGCVTLKLPNDNKLALPGVHFISLFVAFDGI